MIASKGQLVRLIGGTDTAKVSSIIYSDQPEGDRGVRLDKPLDGSVWAMESDLESPPDQP